MSIALVTHVASTGGTNGSTTGSVDTTGATLCIVVTSDESGGGRPTISDSKSNTYTVLTPQAGGAFTPGSQIAYVANPTVGTGHTFTGTGTGMDVRVYVACFSGTGSSPFDQQNGAYNASAPGTLQPGSVTPSENNEVVITACATSGGVHGGNPSIDGGFTVTDSADGSPGVAAGGGLAYLIQTTATAANPTWTTFASVMAATIATFKVAAAAGNLPPGQSTGFWD